ncbi:hypothetical protein Hanom_Chr16g01463701 [Helianthus anomalus]
MGTRESESDTDSESDAESDEMEEFEEGEFRQNIDGEENQNQSGDIPIPVAQQDVVQSPVTVVEDFFQTCSDSDGNERSMGNGRSPVAQGKPKPIVLLVMMAQPLLLI